MLGIWNNIDITALYLGLDRLQGESNEDFQDRLKQISKYHYRTDYYNLVHNIPIQLGLKTESIGRIVNSRENIFECRIEWDYFYLNEILSDGSFGECLRIFIGDEGCLVSKIKANVDASTYFTLEIHDSSNLALSVDFLIRGNSVKVETEVINNKFTRLLHSNLVPNSFVIDSPSFVTVKSSLPEVMSTGDYFVDNKVGFLYSYDNTFSLAKCQYRYFDSAFALEKTDVNLIPIRKYFNNGYSDKSIGFILDLLDRNIVGT